MQEDDANEAPSDEAHWCIDCELCLHHKDQQKSWDFCDFCGDAVCVNCDRSHACAALLRKKPRH